MSQFGEAGIIGHDRHILLLCDKYDQTVLNTRWLQRQPTPADAPIYRNQIHNYAVCYYYIGMCAGTGDLKRKLLTHQTRRAPARKTFLPCRLGSAFVSRHVVF